MCKSILNYGKNLIYFNFLFSSPIKYLSRSLSNNVITNKMRALNCIHMFYYLNEMAIVLLFLPRNEYEIEAKIVSKIRKSFQCISLLGLSVSITLTPTLGILRN